MKLKKWLSVFLTAAIVASVLPDSGKTAYASGILENAEEGTGSETVAEDQNFPTDETPDFQEEVLSDIPEEQEIPVFVEEDFDEVETFSTSGSLKSMTFTTTNIRTSKTINFRSDSGKTQVLIFGGIGSCENTSFGLGVFSKLADSMDMDKINLYAIDIKDNSNSTILSATKSISNAIQVGEMNSEVQSVYYAYVSELGLGSYTMPLIVYLDADGEIYAYSTGEPYDIEQNLGKGGVSAEVPMQRFRISGKASYSSAYEVLEILNQERVKKGLALLQMDRDLLEAAMQRAAECAIYYSHTRPDLMSCYSASPKMSRENIAAGQNSPNEVMNGWMNFSGHYANIMAEDNQSVGIGCVYHAGQWYWVQCFGRGAADTLSQSEDIDTIFDIDANEDIFSAKLEFDSRTMSAGEKYTLDIYKPITLDAHEPNPDLMWAAADIDNSSYQWISSNPAVASVDANGVVTGLSAGTATITGTNIGGKGTVLKFTAIIEKIDISSATISFDKEQFEYTGSETKPMVSVVCKGKTLQQGTDYEISYTGNINAGTGTVTITGAGSYTGTLTRTFTITPKSINQTSVSPVASQKYTGKAIKPTVAVKDGGKVLVSSTDYTVSYSNNIQPGTADVVITGTGNYTGTKTVHFTITEQKPAESTKPKKGDECTYKNVLYNVLTFTGTEGTAEAVSVAKKSITSVNVPDTVEINGYSFKVVSVKSSAFTGCTKLKAATLGKNVASIGKKAFYGCADLTSVNIPASVKKLEDSTFSGCKKLKTVDGCAGITTVGSKVFYKCEKLVTVGSKGNAITLSKVKTIGNNAFYGCKAVKKVNLTSKALTKIGDSAFQECASITSFTSKSTKLTTIGKKAFYGDKKLGTISLKTEKLNKSKTGSNAFKGIKSTCKFKVPKKQVSTYKAIFKAKGAGNKFKVSKL